ncbi:MAG TPA: trypsin-like peptidase domain-containing protein [Acidimicrobiales bacterium]|nr:trypsin-like peptidase domain-containing protein [Acidimicrobiales bacterium]
MNDSWPPSPGSSDPKEDEPVTTDSSPETAAGPGPSLPGYPYGNTHPSDLRQPGGLPLPPPPPPAGGLYPPPPALASDQQPTQQHPTQPIPPTPPAGTWWPAPAPVSGWDPAASGTLPPPPPPGGWAGGPAGPTPPPGAWFHPGYAGPPPAQPTAIKKRRGLVAGLAAAIVAVAVVAGAGLGHVVWSSGATPTSSAAPGITNPGGSASPGNGNGSSPFGSGSSGSNGNSSTGAGAPSDIAGISAKVNPALVDINTNLSYQNEQAAGTGMVLTSDGVILTNNHVIDGATSISVTDIGNGKTYTANVVGYDRTGDIAVIKLVNASGLKTIATSSGTAAVGQAIVGIGNAGGAGGTPSAAGGSITALNQSITASDNGGGNAENLTGLIEINAGIQPGDSGGPLVNTSGQVIGMDTAASSSNGYQVSGSQAYAIPIGTALSIAKQIQAGTASNTIHIGATGFLGISVQSSSSTGNGGFGGGGNGSGGNGNSATSGATIVSVLPNSAAASAGLAQGDVITALNGTAVNAASDLSNLLVPHHPGDTVQLQWTDQSGQTHTAGVTLATGPPA